MFKILLLNAFLVLLFTGCSMHHSQEYYRLDTSDSAKLVPDERLALPTKSLSLPEVLEIALHNSHSLRSSQWMIVSQEQGVKAKVAEHWPVLLARGGYRLYSDEQRLEMPSYNGEKGVFSHHLLDGGLVLQLPLYSGGRISGEIAVSKLMQQSAEHSLSRSKRELLYNCTSLFYAILSQKSIIKSFESSQKAMENQLAVVNDLVAAKRAVKVDILRLDVKLADIKQGLLLAQNSLIIQKSALLNLLGVDDDNLQLTGDLVFAEFVVDDKLAMKRAFSSRADLQALQKTIEAQGQAVNIAKARGRFQVVADASYGGRWAMDDGESSNRGSVGVGVSVPIFEYGKVRAMVKKEKAKLNALQERLCGLRKQVRYEVKVGLLNLSSASARVAVLAKSITQAQEVLRLASVRHRAGKSTLTDLFDAQSALLQVETNHCKALAAYNRSIAQLNLAIGEEK